MVELVETVGTGFSSVLLRFYEWLADEVILGYGDGGGGGCKVK